MTSAVVSEIDQELLAELLADSQDAFCVLNEKGQLVYINKRAANIIGYKKTIKPLYIWDFEEVVSSKLAWKELFAKLDKHGNALMRGRHKHLIKQTISHVEVNAQVKEVDGEKWITAAVRVIDERVHLEQVNAYNRQLLSTLTHIHERLLQEDNYIEALEQGFQELADVINVDRIYLFQAASVDGKVVTMSQRLEWNSGEAQAQLNNPDLQHMPAQIMETAMIALEQRQVWTAIIEELAHSEEREILASQDIQSMMIAPIYPNEKELWGFIGFDDCQNKRSWSHEEQHVLTSLCNGLGSAIDRSKKATMLNLRNEELERLSAYTSEQNEQLMNFAYTVSHNMRSHSSNISGLLHLMEVESEPKRKAEYSAMLHKSAAELARTIKELNEVVSGGKQEETLSERVEINTTIQDAISVVENTLRSIDATVTVEVDGQLAVAGRAAYLDSIILNLITNAIKYRSKNRLLELHISAKALDDSEVEIQVRDNGSGINMEAHGDHVFGMYKTFHENEEAVGLGLYLVKSQIDEMGGEVSVVSKVEVGTTFTIKLKQWLRKG